jgi:hypothetical protein
MALVLAACLCFGSGFALVSLGWPRRRWLASGHLANDLLVRASLSIGFGLGIFSVTSYVSLIWHFSHLLLVDAFVFAVLVAARVVELRIAPVESEVGLRGTGSGGNNECWPVWLRRALTATFFAVLIIALYAEVNRTRAFPHGDGWDAFTIWNLHARFLFLGGEHWRDGFSALVGGSHPDYPLLLPAAIAQFWTFLGHDDPRVPAMIGIAFAFATAGVLFAGLVTLRGRVQAMVAAIALLSTPFFIEQGADQYADIPLSFFLLATVVLLCFSDHQSGDEQRHEEGSKKVALSSSQRLLILAGLVAGFAAWTKNEGLLFLLAVALSRVVILARMRRRAHDDPKDDKSKNALAFWGTAAPLLLGLLPGLVLVLYYKHSIGIAGDLFSDPANALPKLLDPARYWAIFAGYVKGLVRFGHWLWMPGTVVLAALFVMCDRDRDQTRQSGFRTSVLALGLTFIGYFAVFLITPYDIHWHLRFSLVRLFLQLWPSALFLSFLALSWCDGRWVSASPKTGLNAF